MRCGFFGSAVETLGKLEPVALAQHGAALVAMLGFTPTSAGAAVRMLGVARHFN